MCSGKAGRGDCGGGDGSGGIVVAMKGCCVRYKGWISRMDGGGTVILASGGVAGGRRGCVSSTGWIPRPCVRPIPSIRVGEAVGG